MRTGTRADAGAYAGREVYPNSPLEFVAAEIRFSYVPSLAHPGAQDALASDLKDFVPVLKREKIQTISLSAGGPPTTEVDDLFRLLDRTSRTSVSIQTSRVVIETTAYPQFERFRELIFRTVAALDEHHSISGVERVGLRYIDEIRVPVTINNAADWADWVDSRLLAAAGLRDDTLDGMQAVLHFSTGTDLHLTFRFGAISGPSVVGQGALRRRKEHGIGRYFLLDLDSYWQVTDETPAFAVKQVMETIDDLHRPAGETFASVITERLKDEVLRRMPDAR